MVQVSVLEGYTSPSITTLSPNKTYRAPLFGALQIELSDGEFGGIVYNDHPYECSVEQTNPLILPIIPREDGTTEVVLELVDGRKDKYKLDHHGSMHLDKKYKLMLSEFHYSLDQVRKGGVLLFAEVLTAIKTGQLLLLQMDNPLSNESEDSLLEQIEESLPYLQNIYSRPRMHLRVEEEIRDVELVKRVNPNALRHLASHSEHWKAMQVNQLIPARLLAEIQDDELTIYENRFVKTLMDRMKRYLDKKKAELELNKKQVDNLIDWEQYSGELNDYKRLEMLYQLLPDFNGDEQQLKQEIYLEILERVDKIYNQLYLSMNSNLYQKLRRSQDVFHPIRPTNILKMDSNYHRMYLLWNEMEMEEHAIKQEDIGRDPTLFLTRAYSEYCIILLSYALHLSGFQPLFNEMEIDSTLSCAFENEHYLVDISENIFNGNPMIILELKNKLNHRFELPFTDVDKAKLDEFNEYLFVEEGHIVFIKKPSTEVQNKLVKRFNIPQTELKRMGNEEQRKHSQRAKMWQQFISDAFLELTDSSSIKVGLVPSLIEFHENDSPVEQITKNLLDEALTCTEELNLQTTIMLIPSSLGTISSEVEEHVVRRVLNYGEAFSHEDSLVWGNYRTGILPISHRQINSVMRMTKLIQLYTFGQDLERQKPFTSCPICNHDAITKEDPYSYHCPSCHAIWGLTNCTHSDCMHEFPWIRPKNLHLKTKTKLSFLKQLEKLENIGGSTILTGFLSQKEEVNAIPICPKCGRAANGKNKYDV
jgi:hypothetical protein